MLFSQGVVAGPALTKCRDVEGRQYDLDWAHLVSPRQRRTGAVIVLR
jgi:hypothetical protein